MVHHNMVEESHILLMDKMTPFGRSRGKKREFKATIDPTQHSPLPFLRASQEDNNGS
jgi:hypothetical protein